MHGVSLNKQTPSPPAAVDVLTDDTDGDDDDVGIGGITGAVVVVGTVVVVDVVVVVLDEPLV